MKFDFYKLKPLEKYSSTKYEIKNVFYIAKSEKKNFKKLNKYNYSFKNVLLGT